MSITSTRRAPGNVVDCHVSRLPPISLRQTNELAQMLSRVDNKYIVDGTHLRAFIAALGEEFAVLEIGETRHFTYASCYYDDDFACYFDHHQGRRQRMKVRTREYMDSGDRFFEVKLKGLRGMTEKHRVSCDFLFSSEIRGEQLEMLRKVYASKYSKDMHYVLRPALTVGYRRCTLVALRGGERVTIDYRLTFEAPGKAGRAVTIDDDFFIVETKSPAGRGLADQAMKSLRVRTASACSKYCLGVNLVGAVRKGNQFRAAVRRIGRNVIRPGSRVSSPDANVVIGRLSCA